MRQNDEKFKAHTGPCELKKVHLATYACTCKINSENVASAYVLSEF